MDHRKIPNKKHCVCGGEVKYFEKHGTYICEVVLKDEMFKMGYVITEAFV